MKLKCDNDQIERYIMEIPQYNIMGLFDIFSRKKTEEDAKIKQDIAEIGANLKELSEKVRVSDKNIETIYEVMDQMLREIEKNTKDIANMSKTANTGDNGISEIYGAEIADMKKRLESTEWNMLENGKKISQIMRISRLSIQNYDDIKEIKQHLGSKEKEVSQKNLSIEADNKMQKGLSSKEGGILNALLNSEIPLTYEEIAAHVNSSPITVKGYINTIKKLHSGIIVENIKGRGRKAYSIKQEYRLKVLSGKG